MSTVNFEQLVFEHLVIFEKDNTVFAAARGNGNHMYLFLINEATGNTYIRNGRADSWEEIYGGERGAVLARVTQAKNNHIPVYRLNGKAKDSSF
jgi:hypothetical protein